jgi:histidine triad (HIT) family protein
LPENDCLFCKISRGEVPANRLLENDDLVAFRDINPQAPVHILIIPREHIPSLGDVDDARAELVGKLHLAARDLARRAGLESQGWRVVTNVGNDAGQTVQHLHLHLLGGRAMHWPPG